MLVEADDTDLGEASLDAESEHELRADLRNGADSCRVGWAPSGGRSAKLLRRRLAGWLD